MSDLDAVDSQIAAVFVETVQGEAGAIEPNIAWLQELRKRCDKHGVLLVFDEIQAGVGRTGTLWAFEQYGVEPDILLLAKGIGGGLPIGLVIADKKLTDLFTHNPILGHINTFGGNAISAAAALATFSYIVQEKPYLTIPEKEAFIRSELAPYPVEITGKGFLLAGHMNTESDNFAFIKKCIENGLITDWFLFNSKAFRMAPPLIIEQKELNLAMKKIKKALDTVKK
jgi:acetylornithine/succinyldiaminopimelate/putrescine aminotransferase